MVCFDLMDFVTFRVMYKTITEENSSFIEKMWKMGDENPDLPLNEVMEKLINEDSEAQAEYKKHLNELLENVNR